MGQVPEILHGKPFAEYIANKQSCLMTKADNYYNKVIGGVSCNPVELAKLTLINYLLSKYNTVTGEASDYIYNKRPFLGVNDDNYTVGNQLNSYTYLEDSTKYLNKICKQGNINRI